MTHYVNTIAFSRDCDSVLLVRKKRPEYLAGMWNGVGGKIEDGELPSDAAMREFHEETGIQAFDYARYPRVGIVTWDDKSSMTIYGMRLHLTTPMLRMYTKLWNEQNQADENFEEIGAFFLNEKLLSGMAPLAPNMNEYIFKALQVVA